MKHKHEGRVAETYLKDASGKLVWVGYAVDQPPGAVWLDEHQAWVLDGSDSSEETA